MNIVFMGTPDFAVEALRAIYNSNHKILAVVTQTDKPVGRKAIITPCAVKVEALSLSLNVLSYEKISRDGVQDLKALAPDVIVTCAYGQILSNEILDIPKYGVINIHASLLPKYRGSSPIQWAIINGEEETGVTIMQTALGVDTGDILTCEKTAINKYETAGELFERLSKMGANLIVKTLDLLESGKITPVKQDEAKATHVKMLSKQDGLLDFNKFAKDIVNKIHGLNPWPCAFTYLDGKMLKIFKAEVADKQGEVGTVLASDISNGLVIAAKNSAVLVKELQLEGSKRLDVKQFLLGKKIPVGYKFI
ncbi:MAG: methionyl-tRNA formyltransferase [Clostridia bacterium]|nr:methionyl-tRNA formyltransferase [Clostridia bacterium]